MLSFLDKTPVETPCLDFFKKLPATAFGDDLWDMSIVQALVRAQPCTYGDQKANPDLWGQTIGGEGLCAAVLIHTLDAYLHGSDFPLGSKYLQQAMVRQMDNEIRQTNISQFTEKVQDDFLARKIKLAYEQQPETVVTHFPACHMMYQIKNTPNPLRGSTDYVLFRSNISRTEVEAEQQFSKVLAYVLQQRSNKINNAVSSGLMSRVLFNRINEMLDLEPCSGEKHPFKVCRFKLEQLRCSAQSEKQNG